ncbi:rhodanese-like domain-containing protein [Crocosphaera sp. Alani8]|uniref:rhodanese-like domain-containing protein n=1 Tax=Crocosphaera sp. Alani8 TaxID=3038952 RepID=UPI00313C8DDF
MKLFYSLKWNLLNWIITLRFPCVNHISTEELVTLLEDKNRESPLLLDARTPLEYAVSHLKGAYFLPHDVSKIEPFVEVPLSTTIITYCSVGYRSAILAQRLQKMGYEKVFNLQGSLFFWFSENRPIFCEQEVVPFIHRFDLFWSFWL